MLKHDSDRLRQLLQEYFQNNSTDADYQELWSLIDEEVLSEELKRLWEASATDQVTIGDDVWDRKMKLLLEKIDEGLHPTAIKRTKKIKLSVFKWVAAACLVVAISTVSFFIYNRGAVDDKDEALLKKTAITGDDRLPGGNMAVLTLSDGRRIILDSSNNGILGQDGGIGILKQGDGQLVYDSIRSKPGPVAYNTVATPHGGQFKIVLQDGSQVWLNSLSSIRYPTVFAGPERKVEISGEAYFEISKNARPFIVKVKQMEVEVLGTHFNINSYENESAVKTTLLEGSVKVKSAGGVNFLKPGQQARLSNNGAMRIVNNVNLSEVIAWKDGVFEFDNADIETIMRQLARWYDVVVEYKKPVNIHFGGSISRNVNLSKVLQMLEETGAVRFEIRGNRIVVQP